MSEESLNPLQKLVASKHPEYVRNVSRWLKYYLAYQGGEEFILSYLKRYSKRERQSDFDNRLAISYNPGDATNVLNDVRDALISRMHEVKRVGDPRYVLAMNTNVDTFRSSMLTFVGTEVLPRLLSQGKVFIAVDDAPREYEPGERPLTLAEEPATTPYVWAIPAEQVQSWSYDDDGRLESLLIKQTVDIEDPVTHLVTKTETQYRYMQLLEANEESAIVRGMVGPGVLNLTLDKDAKVVSQQMLALGRVPVVEVRIAQPLMKDIADMQIALLNLVSTDMSFLFRFNFPVYTEQFDAAVEAIAPRANALRKDATKRNEQVHDVNELDDDTGAKSLGLQTGRRYRKGLERPGYISPSTANLEASMRKQETLSQRIRVACDLAVTSLSVAAVEQSGKSKEADRVGLSAGVRYISTQLENSEREVAALFHEYLASKIQAEVLYPTDYNVTTPEQRDAELQRLIKARSAVSSKTYQKSFSKMIASAQLTGTDMQDQLPVVVQEIDAAPYVDVNAETATMIQSDVREQIVSKETAAKVRGYEGDEQAIIAAETEVKAESIVGFRPMPGVNAREDVTGAAGPISPAASASAMPSEAMSEMMNGDGEGDAE